MLKLMQPNQPGPAPSQPNQYDFILNPNQKQKPSPFAGGGMKKRLLIAAGAALVLIIAVSVIASFISSAGSGPVDQLKAIAARQQEIIRVAETGGREAKSSEGRAFALTTLLSIRTDQQKLQAILTESGIKLTPQELGGKKSAATDEKLAAASANSRYDEAVTEVLTEYLNDYRGLLKTAYDSGPGPNTKAMLDKAFESATALLGVE